MSERPTGPARWLADVLVADAPGAARSMALSLLEGGADVRAIYADVLTPALHEVGRRWERGEITVAQEHQATSVATSIMEALTPLLARKPGIARTAVLAGTEGDHHVVALHMLEDVLEAEGWDVRNLGAATPARDLTTFVRDVRPDAVALSTTLTTHLRAAQRTIESLAHLPERPFILVGGLAWNGRPDAALHMGADGFALDPSSAAELLRACFPAREPGPQGVADDTWHAHGLRPVAADEPRLAPASIAGPIPICAWCGRIRHEGSHETAWLTPAAFFRTAGVIVTHGMCDACATQMTEQADGLRRHEPVARDAAPETRSTRLA